jgi:hypothetical protein
LRLKRAVYPFKETLVTVLKLVSGLQDNLSLELQLLNGYGLYFFRFEEKLIYIPSALMAQQQKKIQDLIAQTSTINI